MAWRSSQSLLQKLKIILEPSLLNLPRELYRRRTGFIYEKTVVSRRTLHTSAPAMASRILTLEEMFTRASLQDFLLKMEREYNDCLNAVNSAELEESSGKESSGKESSGKEYSGKESSGKEYSGKEYSGKESSGKEYSAEEELRAKRTRVSLLTPLIHSIRELRVKEQEVTEMELLLRDEDEGLRELAKLEKDACLQEIQGFRQKILDQLIPEDDPDLDDLVLEVTAGVGGQEAMLFTAEVFDMYQGFAQHQGWSFDVLDVMSSDLGGVRRASASVSGDQCYRKMKFEAGVHRVQRVPKTEKQGRMHTSTMTVAVLPQPTEISFSINPKDLRIETKRASGAGGQHVNTTDSAVRIVHLPSGVVAECQQERSQIKNKEKAMKLLRAKLYGMKLEEETSRRYQQRKVQVGTRGRSEKIRTYNFSQDRVTDHRMALTLHDVKSFLLGEDLLEDMNSSLQDFSHQEALLELLGENNLY